MQKNRAKHIIIKLSKTTDKNTLRAEREQTLYAQRAEIGMLEEFLTDVMQARRCRGISL